jgi:putative N6-adenine-specific DNA methylase
MIMLTGWRGESDFYDPMCGSGTLAIEANMIARRMPPQALRNEFGFMRWNSFDKGLWQQVKRDAMLHMVEPTHRIFASDADTFQMRTARENIENAGFEDDIELAQLDFMELKPIRNEGIIVMNPPYGERMDEENIIPMYKAIGDHLKHACSGLSAWIISSDEAALKRVGLKPSRKFALINGTLTCKFYRFDLFAGKRNERFNKTTDTPSETK